MNYQFKKEDFVLSCSKEYIVLWLGLWVCQPRVTGYRYAQMMGVRGEDILYKIAVPKSKIIKALTC
jgi:hypothetical protein